MRKVKLPTLLATAMKGRGLRSLYQMPACTQTHSAEPTFMRLNNKSQPEITNLNTFCWKFAFHNRFLGGDSIVFLVYLSVLVFQRTCIAKIAHTHTYIVHGGGEYCSMPQHLVAHSCPSAPSGITFAIAVFEMPAAIPFDLSAGETLLFAPPFVRVAQHSWDSERGPSVF